MKDLTNEKIFSSKNIKNPKSIFSNNKPVQSDELTFENFLNILSYAELFKEDVQIIKYELESNPNFDPYKVLYGKYCDCCGKPLTPFNTSSIISLCIDCNERI